MGIFEVKMYGAKCDNCKGLFSYGYYEEIGDIIEEMESVWLTTDNEETYCEECYEYSNSGELIIDTERKK